MQNKVPVFFQYLFPRLQDVLFIGILFAVTLYGPRLFNQDGDLGRHITIGTYILETRSIPTKDIFSHTMFGQPLVPHEWLAEVAFSGAYRLMRLSGDVVLASIVIALTYFLVYKETTRRGVFRLVALFTTLWAAAASSIHWLARPHVFTFLFLAIWTYGLEQISLGNTKRIWYFPLLMLVWSNTHGAFIAGFVVWAVYLGEWGWEFLRGHNSMELGIRLGAIGLSSILITLINPSGWHLLATSFGYISNKYLVSHTVEYLPPDFHQISTWPFMFMIGYGLFALFTGKKLRLREASLLAGWALMSLYSARNIPLFSIITAPLYGELVQSQAEKLPGLAELDKGLREIEAKLHGFFWPALAVLLIAFAFWQNIPLGIIPTKNQYNPEIFPVQAVDWLKDHPQTGNMFNDFIWGGYILYRMWPEQRVFIDGQTDFYGEGLTREYEQVITLNGDWQNILEKYNVTWAIIPAQSPLRGELIEREWSELYRDSTATILRKQ